MDSNVRTMYVPVVVYVPVTQPSSSNENEGSVLKMKNHSQIVKHKSPKGLNVKRLNHKTFDNQQSNTLKSSAESSSKRIRLESSVQSTEVSSTSTNENSECRTSSSNYYPTAFISNPCDQLFGPQPINLLSEYVKNEKTSNNEIKQEDKNQNKENLENVNVDSSVETDKVVNDNYIPAPRWTKVQNSMLEELYRKGRFPKPSEMKSMAKKLNVMDCDVEEWFRKRRGRDRKARRKNEDLKSLIDKYLHH